MGQPSSLSIARSPATPGTSRRAPSGTAPAKFRTGRILLVAGVFLAAVNLVGMPYFLLPMAERLRSPLHPWFKPSGYVGQTAGIVAFVLFAFLWLYPLRKKFRFLSFTGTIARWLDVHIVAGILVPLIGAIHASWKFEGLIGLGYFAMLTVSFSGIVGKYLYTHIPRTRQGSELSREELDRLQRALVVEIAKRTGIDPGRLETDLEGVLGSNGGGLLSHLLFDDIARWRASRKLRRLWRDADITPQQMNVVVRLARRRMALGQRTRILDFTRRMFRYWHIGHRPFAITALVAVLVHVGIAVALGVTWLW